MILATHSLKERMKMKARIGFGIAVALACSVTAFGRIGDTLAECTARYGNETGNLAADQIMFVRDHIVIVVYLRDGRSFQEDFALDAGGPISETQIAQLLAENAEGSTWELNGETPVETDYFRNDGKASVRLAKPGALTAAAPPPVRSRPRAGGSLSDGN